MLQLATSAELEAKRSALRRNRRRATGMLLAAVLIFAASFLLPDPGFVVLLCRTAAEAAIVGGLADWFAVTALFRRPLGLPIPHTALVLSRKDEIGRSMGNFVRDQFLDPGLLTERLRRRNRALQLAAWLDSPTAAEFAAARAVDIVPMLLESADDTQIRGFVSSLVREALNRIDPVPTVDAVLDEIVRSGRHMDFVDALADIASPSLRRLKEPIIARVGERTGKFFPSYFDRKIGKGIVDGAQNWLDAIRTPGSDEREQLDSWLTRLIEDFRASPDYPQMLRDAQSAFAGNPAVVHSLAATWDEIKREVLRDASSSSPRLGTLTAELTRTSGRLLRQMPKMQDYINRAIERALVDYIAPWRNQIGNYIAEVVASWDGPKLAETIETQVGSDLQFIRMNGTIVGALIGSGLFLAASLIEALR